jgi:hypothetical protein
MQVLTRPFAIEPVTNMMLPDGIFDNALFNLRIACHYTNESGADLTGVEIYLESVGDPGIVPDAQTHHFERIAAGASVFVSWDANFEHATPGKRLVSFVASANGHDPRRVIKQIFVSQTRFDSSANTYTCEVEEGTLEMSAISAIVSPPSCGHREGDKCVCDPHFGPDIPTGVTLVWAPNPAFAGVHGDLPFSDPWWKVLAVVILIIAAIVAIVAAALGAGTASFGAKGTFEETDPSVQCCSPAGGPGGTEFTVAGVASAIATGAAIVACSDDADPFWRGQEATPPQDGELTVGERVQAKWSFQDPPNAGTAYSTDVEWTYTRYTTGQTYEHSISETQTNTHVIDDVQVQTPATVKPFDPLWVQATFDRGGGKPFVGSELYAFVLFRSPGGLFFVRPLTDDGLGFDPAANDRIYAGSLDLEAAWRVLLQSGEKDVRGTWRVYVFAQDVNQTQPGTPPEIAAQEIGGFFVAAAIQITFDPSLPCPLDAIASIEVV